MENKETTSEKFIVGIDFNETSVKAVLLKKSGEGYLIVNYAFVPITDLSRAIENAWKSLKTTTNQIHLSLPNQATTIRRIKLPEMNETDLKQAINWEAKNFLPFPVENAVIRHEILNKIAEKGANQLDILIAAVNQEKTSKILKIAESLGLQVLSLVPPPIAIWQLISHAWMQDPEKNVAIIDIGAKSASLSIFHKNILQFTREISVAGDTFTKSLTGALVADNWQINLTYKEAEELKIKYGLPAEDNAETFGENKVPVVQIRSILRPTLRRLGNEILRSFDYYREQFAEEKIDILYLTGGSSQLKNLDNFLATTLGIEVKVLSGCEKIQRAQEASFTAEKLAQDFSGLSTALGLAVDGEQKISFLEFKKEKKAFNLPQIAGLNKFAKLSVPAFVPIVICFLIILSGLAFNFYLDTSRKNLSAELAQKESLLNDLKILDQRKSILKKITSEETKVRETLGRLNALLPKQIILNQLTYDQSSKKITLTGQAFDYQAIGTLLKEIESSPFFSKARLVEMKKNLAVDPNIKENNGPVSFSLSFQIETEQ